MQDYKQPGFWKFLDNEVYLHRDVVVEGKLFSAIERWNRWFLVPIDLDLNKGPRLMLERVEEVTRDYVYSLRLTRDIAHEAGI